MAGLGTALERLRRSNERLAAHDGKRDPLRQKRDQDLRDAEAAGATWAELRSTGLSNATIAKALKQ